MVYRYHSNESATILGLRKVGGQTNDRLKADTLGKFSSSSINRYAAQVKLTGTGKRPTSDHLTRGRKRKLTREETTWLSSLHLADPSIPAKKLAYGLLVTHGKQISSRSVYRYLHREGMSYKKLEKRAKEADPVKETVFLLKRRCYRPSQLIAMDESHFDSRCENSLYGWAKKGARAIKKLLFRRHKSFSVMGILTIKGLLGVPVMTGSCTAERLVKEVLEPHVFPFSNPWPLPNSVIVWDNHRTHHSPVVVEAIKARGMRILYTPPYSPWWQPNEFLFGSVKNGFRSGRFSFSHPDGPEAALGAAFKTMVASGADAEGYFAHCGWMGQLE